jgi:site-specific DNA recombinase
MNQPAAIYARVSSDRQKEDHTIASQTVALLEFAKSNGYVVPAEWVFQDEGYSGASLVRPGLEALRDLAAQGQITTVLIYSPDRLSRKYAYQVLLAEELSRCGVEIVFLKSPTGGSPEDQLVVQFQGMIAEYERAQIAERSRRGKLHKAREGVVNVLGGAPYGYRYVKKTDTSAAYYQVIESEAGVVRLVFQMYTKEHLNIRAIARSLNERGIPTRTGKTRWERSTVWGLLRNPAYQGKACYGKTELRPRQRITRPVRQRNGMPNRNSANHERPRSEWIEVPVPALVSEEIFALAQEQLAKNKHHSPRRTIEPTLLQGMLVCQRCGYALYRASTRTTKRRLHYYRCLGSDAHRQLKGPLCTNRPIRQDYLDQFVWDQIIRLLEDDTLMQAEIDRRKETARNADPRRQRQDALHRERVRLGNNVERLITAYQEGLISLLQLRERMPELTKKSKAVEAELQSLETGAMDRARYLQLAENLSAFREKLHARAKTLDVCERQHILRLLVKEVLVDTESLTIRHAIPIPQTQSPAPIESPASKDTPPSSSQKPSYLLRPRANRSSLWGSPSFIPIARAPMLIPFLIGLLDWSFQPHLDQMQHRSVDDPSSHRLQKVGMWNRIEVAG